MNKLQNVEVSIAVPEFAQEQFDAGLMTFEEMKQRLEVTITMNEDYVNFKDIMKLLNRFK